MPQALAARLAVFVVTTVATTVVPVMLQDRPVLRWTWGKFGPVIQTRVADRVQDRLAPPEVDVDIEINHRQVPVAPAPYNDGVDCTTPACFDPCVHHGPVLNPNDYCRRHWWTAGPVRRIISFPFRLFRR
jgi:hypothetical protein